ncbi:LacI family DNA-binding transcriptional regulator [Oceanobacillus sp. FSL W8-0428]|uniref:LacI family DNA-binding transcriptional regulator n=1 Tax=Oceanobacillus TaxID=182709 RepID=UPI001FE976D3|nr:LacI family DNA-binding transcriptional regulator [Oceanobacillus oncorhynchi]
MKEKRPTIYDVAKEAGVSISTVSKVMNGTGSIADKTKKKVEASMQKLSYQPIAAPALQKRLQTIGLLIPSIADPFSAEIARKIEDNGRKYGFSLIVCSTDNNLVKEKEYIAILRKKYVDGIIIATGLKNAKALQELKNSNIPIALLSREVPSLPLNTVLVNDYLGAYEATSYLIKKGHQRIAMITEDMYFSSVKARVDGYKQALEDEQMEASKSLISIDNSSFMDASQSAGKLVNMQEPPTAIFASTEPLAIGAMQGVREAGLMIPDDVSIVGFDNSILAQMCYPQLTTVAQPTEEMAEKIVQLLVEEINGTEKVKQRIVLAPKLVIRGTVGEGRQ